jgi:16S rRNA (uracil1498-N3)-methyltransferase
MRISRIYTEQILAPDSKLELDQKTSHYLSRVLKLRVGSPLVVFNGDGFDYVAELVSVKKDGAKISISTRLPAIAESPLAITLVQAISRGERMDYSLQKATELGVHAICPVISERVEVKLDQKRLEGRMLHWSRVVISACEQSGRARVPEISPPVSLDEWIAGGSGNIRLVLNPISDQTLTGQTLEDSVELLVGAEGGFSDVELNKLKIGGVRQVSMGSRILRTETAGPAAIAILQSMAGDI